MRRGPTPSRKPEIGEISTVDAVGRVPYHTQRSVDPAIVFVSMNNDADVVREALSTGAKGYVLKADAGNELWAAVEAVLQSKQYLSRGLRGRHSVTIN